MFNPELTGMREPLFATSIRVSCGCGWHPVSAHGNATLKTVVELFDDYHQKSIAHAQETGHCIEMFIELRPHDRPRKSHVSI